MSKMIKIGNIRDLQGGGAGARGGRGLGLGGRIKALTTHALDRGEAVAKQAIDDLTLEEELSPEEQEALAEGLDYISAILAPHETPACLQAKAAVRGLYDAIGAFDQVDGEGDEEGSGGIVDVIGLDGAGGFVRPGSSGSGEWR